MNEMNAAESNQTHDTETRKRKRGEIREDGMVFWGYKRGKEKWVTPERLAEVRKNCAAKTKARRMADPEKARQQSRESHARNHEKEREHYRQNRDRILKKNKEWSMANREKHRALIDRWNEENPEKLLEYSRKHKASDKGKEYMREYVKRRRRENPQVLMAERIRARLRVALSERGYGKDSLTMDVLGCSWGEFVAHIESQFTGGLSWENKDEWHIDHHIPIDAARDVQEVKMLNYYTNLKPMWGSENLKKSDNLPENFLALWNNLCKVTGNECKIRM
jgi:hypothetical protein